LARGANGGWKRPFDEPIPLPDGREPDGVAQTEADHFGNCPVCGAFIDMRDLGQVLAHVHDQEIEIGEGPNPPRREAPVQ
jgi:hypothetical protein